VYRIGEREAKDWSWLRKEISSAMQKVGIHCAVADDNVDEDEIFYPYSC